MTKSRRSTDPQLDQEGWVRAAMEALSRGGLRAVAVEPLARSLGVTKGSFYWHFKNRGELIEALLDAFEARATDAVVHRLEPIPDPAERLTTLVAAATSCKALGREVALATSAAAGEEPIASRYRRVSARRQRYLIGLYEQIGVEPEEAVRFGTATYTWFLGLLHRLAIEGQPADPEAVRQEAKWVVERLLSLAEESSNPSPDGASIL
ncbi:MAG: TetR/AcrR family transcriptional regulator [Acidobacteriota bacterium]